MSSPRKNGTRLPGWSADAFRLLREVLAKQTPTTLNSAAQHAPAPDRILALLEDLRIREIELEMQNAELCLAQADLKASRAHYVGLYERAPVGYVTLDDHGVITEMNPRATELLGNIHKTGAMSIVSPEARTASILDWRRPSALWNSARALLDGQSFYQLIAAEYRDVYYLSRRRLLMTGAPQFCELKILRPEAPPFWARLEMSLGRQAAAQVCHLVIVDIDESKLAELQVEESKRQLRHQANVLPQMIWASAPDDEIDCFNERCYEYTGLTPEQAKEHGW